MTAQECRRRREAHGLTIARLAALAGVSERTALRFETQSVQSRYGTMLALKRALQGLDAGVGLAA
ncbi:hypothetical protein LJR219_003466 [Phenylobacterium sp. LjRoot219]|uniref:helix-turn-helix domain-containing protein n=1 Tax=Phenylobacterium sp. LjRoot219 TaxID=3342283 RepID=UPI003ECFBE94